MKRLLKLLIILGFTNIIYAQETKSPNIIIYFEAFGGFSVITDAGFGGGFEINYQNKKDLFSFRLIEVAGYSKDAETAYLPSYNRTNHNNEYAFLYGKMKFDDGHWEPNIENIHLSERIEKDSLKSRIIEITPIISVSEKDNQKGGVKKFNFKNEHTITSNHWGNNYLKFVCGNKEQIIILHQRK